ncbi:hypothetical protein NCS52_01559100 [Fusarium sp. LHS14.1]|nr:hypothetical protein NCS52_01559100 [Fusarium sp. LHS14.1]
MTRLSSQGGLVKSQKPNDRTEQDHMDLVHHVYRLLLDGKLCRAPIPDNVQRVLDLSTGTGVWAMDFAKLDSLGKFSNLSLSDENASKYRLWRLFGTNFSPLQPKWTPPNCRFEVDDFERDWLYAEPFDFIHAREIEGCISDRNMLFRRVFRRLKPDGVHPLALRRQQRGERRERPGLVKGHN